MPTIFTIQYSHSQTLLTGWELPLVLTFSPLHSVMKRQEYPLKSWAMPICLEVKKTDWKKLPLVGSLAQIPGPPHNAKTKTSLKWPVTLDTSTKLFPFLQANTYREWLPAKGLWEVSLKAKPVMKGPETAWVSPLPKSRQGLLVPSLSMQTEHLVLPPVHSIVRGETFWNSELSWIEKGRTAWSPGYTAGKFGIENIKWSGAPFPATACPPTHT